MPLEWSNKQIVEILTFQPEPRDVRIWIGTQVREASHAARQFLSRGGNPHEVHSTIVEGPGSNSGRQGRKGNNRFVLQSRDRMPNSHQEPRARPGTQVRGEIPPEGRRRGPSQGGSTVPFPYHQRSGGVWLASIQLNKHAVGQGSIPFPSESVCLRPKRAQMEFTNAQRAPEGLLLLLCAPGAERQLTEALVETEGISGARAVCGGRFSLFQSVGSRIKPALLNLDG